MRRIRPPITYWGGKYYASAKIAPYIPPGIKTAICPFIGGGSIELTLALNGTRVAAGDAFRPIADLWTVLVDAKLNERMRDIIRERESITRQQWNYMRREYDRRKDIAERAAWFYMINNHSFSGFMWRDSTFIPRPQRALLNVDHLKDYVGLPITCQHSDFAKLLKTPAPNALIFCDPPYSPTHDKRQLYGRGDERKFDHARLKRYLDRQKYWLMTYDDQAPIRELYDGYTAVRPEYLWTSGHKVSGHPVRATELLIFSPALAEACPAIDPTKIKYTNSPLDA